MSHETTAAVMGIVHAIADVVQRHGQHDFRPDSTGCFSRIVTLCGLTVQFDGLAIKRLTTHDFDLYCTPDSAPLTFRHGSADHLKTWHRKILQFDQFFCPSSFSDLSLAQAA
jgi:hypothetical protein